MKKDGIFEELLKVSKEIGLPVKKILDMLYFLRGGAVENSALVGRLGISRHVLNQVKRELSDLFEPVSELTALSGKGRVLAGLLFPEGYRGEEALWSFLEEEQFSRVNDLLKKYRGLRLNPL